MSATAHSELLPLGASVLGKDSEQLGGPFNLTEAAALLGIAPSTLRQRALAGLIRYQRDGRRWIFTPTYLREYALRREVAPAAESTGPKTNRAHRPGPCASQRWSAEAVEAEARALGLISGEE